MCVCERAKETLREEIRVCQSVYLHMSYTACLQGVCTVGELGRCESSGRISVRVWAKNWIAVCAVRKCYPHIFDRYEKVTDEAVACELLYMRMCVLAQCAELTSERQ